MVNLEGTSPMYIIVTLDISVHSSSPRQVIHFDVNNEALHGYWYEGKTLDPDFTDDMITMMNQLAPNVKLFLNDYNVVAAGMYTQVSGRSGDGILGSQVGDRGVFGMNLDPSPLKKN